MKQTTIVFIYFCFILSSCSLFNKGDLSAGTYEGFYAWGFETNSFKPCQNLDEDWWVIAGNRTEVDSLISSYQAITDQDYEDVFVRLVGDPSKKGEYGHLGGSEREFELEEIIEIRKAESSDCN